VQTFDQFTVSAGVAGNALAEVNAKFPVSAFLPSTTIPPNNPTQVSSNLASTSASDLAIISEAAQIAEQAEIATGGFNDAITAAGGTGTIAGTALQNGKIKNKVLKLQTDVLRIQIEVAQGNTASQSSLAAQQAKLATNVALDKKAAGQKSTAISFSGGSD
jgi:1-aminocyclopropane-1-carboxylate deaminase/D-cysteine desulfhydrase-like pyridoxal-dependent ACC family enzyme